MMGKKKLSDIKAQVAEMLHRLPEGWMAKEIESAKKDPSRNPETLKMIMSALETPVKKRRRPKVRRPAKH